jgi:hypothetical protein
MQQRVFHSLQSREPSVRDLKEVILLINLASLKVNGQYLIMNRAGLLPLFSSLSGIIGEVNSSFSTRGENQRTRHKMGGKEF